MTFTCQECGSELVPFISAQTLYKMCKWYCPECRSYWIFSAEEAKAIDDLEVSYDVR